MSAPGVATGAGLSAGAPLLDVRGLRVAFGAHEVVRGIDLQLQPGEKLALVGESGSGKTVTALALLRLVQNARLQGSARLRAGALDADLLQMPEPDMQAVRGRDIAMVFQEPMTALNPLFPVGEQIAEVLQAKQGLPRERCREAVIELLAQTGIDDPERRARAYPHQLSGGQRQRAMIAMALACRPALLLADEPTTALDVSVRAQILELLGSLQREHGMAVLLITHDLHLVRRFADRVAVMEQGLIVEAGTVEAVFAAPRHAYTRRLLDSRPRRDPRTDAPMAAGPALLQARNLGVRYPTPLPGVRGWFRKGAFQALQDASFELPAGRTLGVIGESGSGKSTLALAALGLQSAEGEIEVEGRHWGQGREQDLALRRTLQVVFQDPFSSLSPRMTVEEIVGEGLRVHQPALDAAARQREVLAVLAAVGLTEAQFPGLLQRYPHAFSGGQRQRIAVARALIVQPRVLVLDEPTSALDVTIQRQVLDLLQQLQRERGLSYLLITHDVDVIRAMAHEVLVLKGGQVVESGPVAQVLESPRHPYTRTLVEATR